MIQRNLFLLTVLFSSLQLCNAQDAMNYLQQINTKIKRVADYRVDAVIKTDIPFIKMLPIKAAILFKQPDKLRLISKGIAILPKQSIDQIFKTISDTASYTAIIQSKELYKGKNCVVINLIPLSDTIDMVLCKIWIDELTILASKAQITTRTNGTIIAEYIYSSLSYYSLPDSITYTVDIKKFKIPKAVSADINTYNDQQKDKSKESKKGKIYIQLSNYILNKGIADSEFLK